MKPKYFLMIVITFFKLGDIFSQQSGALYRRVVTLNGNEIKTVGTNYTVFGQPSFEGPRLAWKNYHNAYVSDMSILLGLELPIRDYTGDGNPDTIHSVIIAPVDRPGGGENGYGFEPVNGFFNPNLNPPIGGPGFAISTDPNTWPVFWPDHPEWGSGVWNGLFGPNNFVGSLEAYYQIDDANDHEFFLLYGFLPDSTNTLKRGHGIRVNVRYIQLNNSILKDVLFKIYDIKNESLHNYHKLVFGELTGTYIGGQSPEWNDDVSLYYPLDDIIISFDFNNYIDPSANPNWVGKVGKFGQKFIHGAEKKIASYRYFVPAGDITMSHDEELWSRLRPDYYNFPTSVVMGSDSIPYATRGEDGDHMFGSNYFTLNSGESKRIVDVIAFGYSKDEILDKTKVAEAIYHSNFDTIAVSNSVIIVSPSYYQTLSGAETIRWSTSISGGTIELWYSPDLGKTWRAIDKNVTNTGQYTLNTTTIEDCAFGVFKIFAKNHLGDMYGFNQSPYLKINNSSNGKPFIKILNEEFGSGITFTQEFYDFNLLIGDPESNNLSVKVYYSSTGDSNYFYSQSFNAISDSISHVYPVNFKIIPNSSTLKLKFTVSDGLNDYSTETDIFDKQNQREPLNSQYFEKISGYSEVPININIIDPSQFTNHEYIISFEDTSNSNYKTLSVFDLNSSSYVFQNCPFKPGTESPSFAGVTLYTEDINTQLDSQRSRWNHPFSNVLNYRMEKFVLAPFKAYREPFDYLIPFSNTYNDSSNYLYQLFGTLAPPAKTQINFKVFEVRKNLKNRVQFAFTEASSFRRDTLSHLDQITLAGENGNKLSWKIIFTGNNASYVPSLYDTLILVTKKGLSIYDTLRIHDLPVSVQDSDIFSYKFNLEQNFPNPFNPLTKIIYGVPSGLSSQSTKVRLVVYDILGREVKVLVDEEKSAGNHETLFDAKTLASGVYFYQLKVGSYVQTKKMILLK